MGAIGGKRVNDILNFFSWDIFLQLEQLGANVLVEFQIFFFNWGHFIFQFGAIVLVEFKNVCLNWEHFFTIKGILEQMF